MTWSMPQRTLFLRACSAAGWNDEQRYVAMRHAGCPLRDGRPTLKHAGNGQAAFEAVMALAEAQAAMEGRSVPSPRGGGTWRDRSATSRRGLEGKARQIAAEAIRRAPGKFDDGLLDYAVRHVTGGDSADLPVLARPATLAECDEGQMLRVVEALRAMVGRVFGECGLVPQSFETPPSARRRVGRSASHQGAITTA